MLIDVLLCWKELRAPLLRGLFFGSNIVLIQDPSEFGNKYNVPKTIVVHSMGEFILDPHPIHASDFLVKLGYSAHALVAPNGDIHVCRRDSEGAYHARGYNTNSLGIEFLVEGHHNYGTFIEKIKSPFVTDAQWAAGVEHVKDWLGLHDIEQLVRHSDVSPGRKVDPGAGFPWDEFCTQVGYSIQSPEWN